MKTRTSPFHKILIANRGEIALRIIRSAHAMGFRTVAVHSTADADAPHVDAAHEAVCIGEPLPAQSYLRIEAILDAARRSGADAVHPGYGFLAENEDFAAACRDAGLVFIGPSPEAIRAMGDKAGAKAIMSAAGVPCIPGYQGEDQSAERLQAEADKLGYPVMIKATAGGGGRGMRLVRAQGEFAELLRSAQSEAKNAFGDATVILERAIVQPRHIEIQVFADRYGHAVHLGERDCSVQRRHQKVIEEAPSPAVDAALRERMGATAVAAVKAIGYEGAGTLEFLLDCEGRFYFMEMNTRLQVEHPVTEAITGLDLVEWQLRVAAGEPLPLAQEAITFSGHAIEVRLCAEDPARGFMPQGGTLALWQPSTAVRVEHALRSGAAIPPYYDSMIAKVIAHGATRDEARRRLAAALQDSVALGLPTNQAFLAACLAHPAFIAGEATTAFIDAHRDALIASAQGDHPRAEAIAAALLVETLPGARRREGRRLSNDAPLVLRFELDGEAVSATLCGLGSSTSTQVAIDGRTHAIEVLCVEENSARVVCDGLRQRIAWRREGARLWLGWNGRAWGALDLARAGSARPTGGPAGDGQVRASMNGRVVAVRIEPGQRVEAGQALVTLEAMKMEHVHGAAREGRVRAVHVAAGDQVATGRVLVEFEPGPAA